MNQPFLNGKRQQCRRILRFVISGSAMRNAQKETLRIYAPVIPIGALKIKMLPASQVQS
jgi:hypothetical protein